MTFVDRESCVRCFWRETSLFLSSRSLGLSHCRVGEDKKGCNSFASLITPGRSKRLEATSASQKRVPMTLHCEAVKVTGKRTDRQRDVTDEKSRHASALDRDQACIESRV